MMTTTIRINMTNLVDSLGVGNHISVFGDRDGLSGEDGLVHSQCGGVDLY